VDKEESLQCIVASGEARLAILLLNRIEDRLWVLRICSNASELCSDVAPNFAYSFVPRHHTLEPILGISCWRHRVVYPEPVAFGTQIVLHSRLPERIVGCSEEGDIGSCVGSHRIETRIAREWLSEIERYLEGR